MHKRQQRIPTPRVENVDVTGCPAFNGDQAWQQPPHYVRYRERDADEVVNYDADGQDRRWLAGYNAPRPKAEQVTLDVLEAVIDRFEKIRGYCQTSLPPCPAKLPKLLLPPGSLKPSQTQIGDLYEWWKKRLYCRVKKVYPMGKPLIPRFEVRPDPSDIQQPFHHRDIEKNQNFLRNVPRNKLANSVTTYHDLKKQMQMMERALRILTVIKKRETVKRDYFRVQFRIWDLKRRTGPKDERSDTTFDEHVRKMYPASDPLAHSLAQIKDLAQFVEKCRQYDYPIHRFKIRLRPSANVAPPHVSCEALPRFGPQGQIVWPCVVERPAPTPTPAPAAAPPPTASPTATLAPTAFSASAALLHPPATSLPPSRGGVRPAPNLRPRPPLGAGAGGSTPYPFSGNGSAVGSGSNSSSIAVRTASIVGRSVTRAVPAAAALAQQKAAGLAAAYKAPGGPATAFMPPAAPAKPSTTGALEGLRAKVGGMQSTGSQGLSF